MSAPRGSGPIDPTRLSESAVVGALILTLVMTPSGVLAVAGTAPALPLAVLVVLTAAAYGFHALTFDQFRVTRRLARAPAEARPPTVTGQTEGITRNRIEASINSRTSSR